MNTVVRWPAAGKDTPPATGSPPARRFAPLVADLCDHGWLIGLFAAAVLCMAVTS